MEELSRYKVAICTSSIYGYALRKIIEATACGCRVITDLPSDEVLPLIDDNLVRLECNHPTEAVKEVTRLLPELYDSYNPDTQLELATRAKVWYDYHPTGVRLALQIEAMRREYNG
jgi:hypothetical protein